MKSKINYKFRAPSWFYSSSFICQLWEAHWVQLVKGYRARGIGTINGCLVESGDYITCSMYTGRIFGLWFQQIYYLCLEYSIYSMCIFSPHYLVGECMGLPVYWLVFSPTKSYLRHVSFWQLLWGSICIFKYFPIPFPYHYHNYCHYLYNYHHHPLVG